jgi:hypothetical protein
MNRIKAVDFNNLALASSLPAATRGGSQGDAALWIKQPQARAAGNPAEFTGLIVAGRTSSNDGSGRTHSGVNGAGEAEQRPTVWALPT